MAKKIIAGNWKMHKTVAEGILLAEGIAQGVENNYAHQVVLAPPFIHLQAVLQAVAGNSRIAVAAQNCHQAVQGAFTGEVSANMLAAMGVQFVIIGHSERRQYFHEDHLLLAQKVDAVLSAGLSPIFCCGEPLAIRQSGEHIDFVAKQLKESLFHLSPSDFAKIVIAYEPIWAIGTGLTASPEQAQEMHREIRNLLAGQYGNELAANCSILYGGSVKADNARELFSQADVDGGLVGGASLDVKGFLSIIHAV